MTTMTPTRPDFRTQSNDVPQWWQDMRPLEHRVLLTTLIVVIVSFALYGLAQSIKVVDDFAANLITEAASIAITVTVIERLNRQEATRQRKEELISQMASPNNEFALEAVRLLRHYGWLKDGSIQGAWLNRANLKGAYLWKAELQMTNLTLSDLRGVKMTEANLQEANLVAVKLQGAQLTNSNLQGAHLRGAKFDENTTLPDETKWSPDVDMRKFTDPDHPDFWQPDWVKDE